MNNGNYPDNNSRNGDAGSDESNKPEIDVTVHEGSGDVFVDLGITLSEEGKARLQKMQMIEHIFLKPGQQLIVHFLDNDGEFQSRDVHVNYIDDNRAEVEVRSNPTEHDFTPISIAFPVNVK